jgi:two-component SAPR family response regulator
MRVCIIDDEKYAIDVLKNMLESLNDIEFAGTFTDPFNALEQLPSLRADILFLDIEFGDSLGIELADRFSNCSPHTEIIFVTAHPQYALEAFDVNAIDYLLKPVSMPRLKRALAKTRNRMEMGKLKPSQIEAPLMIQSMGSFHLYDPKGNEVAWRTRKVKELFAFLWSFQERPVHKTRLIEELWPDLRIDKANTLLHTTVYQLRKTLKETGIGKNPIQLKNDHYQLIVSFESDLAKVEDVCQAFILSDVKVNKLLELYTGDFLAEEGYQWAGNRMEAVRQSVQGYLERYLEESIQKERNHILIEKCFQKLLDIDLYNETYMYGCLEFYISIKSFHKVDKLYERIKQLYLVELGVEIPHSIKRLYVKYIDNC